MKQIVRFIKSVLVLSLFVSIPACVIGFVTLPSVRDVQVNLAKHYECNSIINDVSYTVSLDTGGGNIRLKCICNDLERAVVGPFDYSKFAGVRPKVGDEVLLWCRDGSTECFWKYTENIQEDLPYMRRYYFVIVLMFPLVFTGLFMMKLLLFQQG